MPISLANLGLCKINRTNGKLYYTSCQVFFTQIIYSDFLTTPYPIVYSGIQSILIRKGVSLSMVKVAHGSQNVFNISNPTRYRCQIFHYHRKLSRLYVSVYQGQKNIPTFYLLFSDVGYIDAPMNWLSAEFDIAERENCIDLMLETGLVGEAIHQFPDAYASITDYARLYEVSTPHRSIRIIASSATMMNQVPGEIL